MSLPELDTLLRTYRQSPSVRRYAEHNFSIWRRIVGGLAMVRANGRTFEPRAHYWCMPERRLLVAYSVATFMARYAPPQALRSLAYGAFRHFETARAQGAFGDPLDAAIQDSRWSDIAKGLREVAGSLPEHASEFGALREVWGAKALGGETLRESLLRFIDETTKEGLPTFEKALWKRVAWFPYLGLDQLANLGKAQRFFCGYYSLFGSTNAYNNAGSQTFAPILQNTDLGRLIGYAERWAKGESPSETRFMVLGRDDENDEPRDCSHYNTVTELFGFLNLHRGPIYNNAAEAAYEQFAKPEDDGKLPRVLRVGAITRTFLQAHPALIDELAKELDGLRSSSENGLIDMEGIGGKLVAKKRPADVAEQVDGALRSEVASHFGSYVDNLSKLDAAAGFFHILLDAVLYSEGVAQPAATEVTTTAVTAPSSPGPQPRVEERRLSLPATLRPIADEALGLLRAGFHVLLAGAPGTGKTTVAQLVGHAWNQRLSTVPSEIGVSDAPRTVVAHSAWATFHTVGGLLPAKDGTFDVRPGIFVEESEEKRLWRLRGECFVLDEMNRADLDRCIGDLYPILSRSVAAVSPAGLPGVDAILDDERFRIVATVNDATLDDIVFPISEGLARRFLRIELPGARLADVVDFISPEGADSARAAFAKSSLEQLYEAAGQKGKLTTSEAGEHLPFGVGYFAPLRAWVNGKLVVSLDPDLAAQARRVLLLALRSMARVRGFAEVLKGLED